MHSNVKMYLREGSSNLTYSAGFLGIKVEKTWKQHGSRYYQCTKIRKWLQVRGNNQFWSIILIHVFSLLIQWQLPIWPWLRLKIKETATGCEWKPTGTRCASAKVDQPQTWKFLAKEIHLHQGHPGSWETHSGPEGPVGCFSSLSHRSIWVGWPCILDLQARTHKGL